MGGRGVTGRMVSRSPPRARPTLCDRGFGRFWSMPSLVQTQIGTSEVDVVTLALMLAGLALFMEARHVPGNLAAAAAAAGLAVGTKVTMIVPVGLLSLADCGWPGASPVRRFANWVGWWPSRLRSSPRELLVLPQSRRGRQSAPALSLPWVPEPQRLGSQLPRGGHRVVLPVASGMPTSHPA